MREWRDGRDGEEGDGRVETGSEREPNCVAEEGLPPPQALLLFPPIQR